MALWGLLPCGERTAPFRGHFSVGCEDAEVLCLGRDGVCSWFYNCNTRCSPPGGQAACTAAAEAAPTEVEAAEQLNHVGVATPLTSPNLSGSSSGGHYRLPDTHTTRSGAISSLGEVSLSEASPLTKSPCPRQKNNSINSKMTFKI